MLKRSAKYTPKDAVARRTSKDRQQKERYTAWASWLNTRMSHSAAGYLDPDAIGMLFVCNRMYYPEPCRQIVTAQRWAERHKRALG